MDHHSEDNDKKNKLHLQGFMFRPFDLNVKQECESCRKHEGSNLQAGFNFA